VTPFILLATQRSGSTWVVDMLNSHPRVVCHGGTRFEAFIAP
jgi:LPS sulfotransferase NodH